MSAKRRLISSGSPLEPNIGFSRAVRVGPILAVAGTAPLNPDGTTAHPGDVYEQTRRCLEIVRAAIEQAGGMLDHLIRTRIMLVGAERWREAARAHWGDVQRHPAGLHVRRSQPLYRQGLARRSRS